jgi:hypothetical protein
MLTRAVVALGAALLVTACGGAALAKDADAEDRL